MLLVDSFEHVAQPLSFVVALMILRVYISTLAKSFVLYIYFSFVSSREIQLYFNTRI